MSFLNKVTTGINLARIIQGGRTVSPVAKQEINRWCLDNPDIGKKAWPDLDDINPAPGFQIDGWSWPRSRYFWLDYRSGGQVVRSRWSNVTGKRKTP